jgi:hypothetical protein
MTRCPSVYVAFRRFREEKAGANDRDQLYKKLLREDGSLFDSHPTFAERVKAVQALPVAEQPEATPAMDLFESPAEIEKELTDFLTGCIHEYRRYRRRV